MKVFKVPNEALKKTPKTEAETANGPVALRAGPSEAMRATTPGFFATPDWKKTALGTPIDLFSSAPLSELVGQRPIILLGGIHGDEPQGVRLAEDTLRWLREVSEKNAALAPWILVPCLNIDGFRANSRTNGRGVDLNRNYPSRDWSPSHAQDRYHPGSAPASEPEVQAIVELIETLQPRLLIHCHSWKPCIVATGAPAQLDAQRLAESTGYKVVAEIGYPTPGSLSRYGWHDRQIPVICIEDDDQVADLDTIWPRFQTGMRRILEDRSIRSDAIHSDATRSNSGNDDVSDNANAGDST